MRVYSIHWCTSAGDWKALDAVGEAEAAHLMREIGPRLHVVVKAMLTAEEVKNLADHAPTIPFGFVPFFPSASSASSAVSSSPLPGAGGGA